jgi:cleavage and polyadenylation specificity factor subunit 1
LAQIYPLWDEDTGDERTAVSASFADPYLIILHNDSTLLILQADESGDLDEVLIGEEISSKKWSSGCLYKDNLAIFSPIDVADRSIASDIIFLFLLSLDCKLFVSGNLLK